MKPLVGNAMRTAVAVAVLSVPALPAAAQGVMYIPLGSKGEIAVIDTQRDTVVRRIPGVPAIHGLAGTPDGRLLFAGSMQEGLAGGGLPPKPAGMSEEEHRSHHARPAAGGHKADSGLSTVSVVRTADNAIIRRITVPGIVHHVAVSPDGGAAVVTHPGKDGISVIDVRSYEVVASIRTGGLPNYAVFSPDGKHLYVTNSEDGAVSEVNTAGWTVRRNIAVGASPEHLVVSADGTTLYVNNVGDGTVSVVSLNSGKAVNTIPVGKALHGIGLSDDGNTLFVSAKGEDKLVAVDLATGQSRRVDLAPQPYHLAAVRGAGKLYVASAGKPKAWIVDQKTLAVLGEINIGGKGHQMVPGVGG